MGVPPSLTQECRYCRFWHSSFLTRVREKYTLTGRIEHRWRSRPDMGLVQASVLGPQVGRKVGDSLEYLDRYRSGLNVKEK